MNLGLEPIRIEIIVKMGFWDAVKLRLAGRHMKHLIQDVERQMKKLADAGVCDAIDRMVKRDSDIDR